MKKAYIICMAFLGWTCWAGNLTIQIEPSEIRTSMSSFEEDHLDLALWEGTNVLDRVYLYWGDASEREKWAVKEKARLRTNGVTSHS